MTSALRPTMPSGRSKPTFVLLHSYSFPEGALLTPDAFLAYLGSVGRDELNYCDFLYVTLEQAANSQYDIISLHEVVAEIVGCYENQ